MRRFLFFLIAGVIVWSVLKNPSSLAFAGPSVVNRVYKIHDALGIEDPVEDPNRTFVDSFDDTATGAQGIAASLKRTSTIIGPTLIDPYVWVTVLGVITIAVVINSIAKHGVGGTIGKVSDNANRGLRKANASSVALLVGIVALFIYIRGKGLFAALSTNSSWLLVVLALFALYAFRGAIGARTQKLLMEVLGWVGLLALIIFGIGALLVFLGKSTAPLSGYLSQIPLLGTGAAFFINLGGTVAQQGTGEQLSVMAIVASLVYGVVSVQWNNKKKKENHE